MTDEIGTLAELRDVLGEPLPRLARKVRSELHELDRQWLAASPFCVIATAGSDGTCDTSPKGDPPGFTHIVDGSTLAIPERPGNKRADTLRNILENPHVGLIYVVPGRGDTLRVNGRARLLRDAPYFDDLVVRGHRPVLAIEVAIDEIYYHCSKAFLRSKLWEPAAWSPTSVARRAVIAQTLERPDDDLAELDRYYGPVYAEKLYR